MGAAVQWTLRQEAMTINQQETIARIGAKQAAVRAFAAEQRASIAKDAQTLWLCPIGGMAAGAALFGAGAEFMKLIGT